MATNITVYDVGTYYCWPNDNYSLWTGIAERFVMCNVLQPLVGNLGRIFTEKLQTVVNAINILN